MMLCDVSARKFGVGALHDSFKSRHEIRKKYDSEFTGFPCNYLTGHSGVKVSKIIHLYSLVAKPLSYGL